MALRACALGQSWRSASRILAAGYTYQSLRRPTKSPETYVQFSQLFRAGGEPRPFSSAPVLEAEHPDLHRPQAQNRVEKTVLYKGRWMVPFRVLLGGVASLAVPLGTFLTEGGISLISVGISGLLLLGCYVSATSLNYYARRYVGELSLVTQPGQASPALCFSVLDFWGNREDTFVSLSDLVPPLRGLTPAGVHQMALQPLVPVQVDGLRQFYVSLRHGFLTDKNGLLDILRGEHALQKQQSGQQQPI